MFKGATSTGAEAVGRDYRLIFVHQATGHSVEFPATIQSFSDSHVPEFSERAFAGKMDPIYQQSAVAREIEFTFVVANGSVEEATPQSTKCKLVNSDALSSIARRDRFSIWFVY